MNSDYPGDWHVIDGILYKGDVRINNNESLVDYLSSLTDDAVTIFLYDTRVATNVMRNGKRAVGTRASQKVIEEVLKKGDTFIGKADVVGVAYQSAYIPMRDSNNNIIGMFYVGEPKRFIFNVITFFLAISIFGTIILFFLIRSISKKLALVTYLSSVRDRHAGVFPKFSHFN